MESWKTFKRKVARGFTVTDPVTKSVDSVHASFRGDVTGTNITGTFTSPDVPRNVRIVFGATWDAGDVTLNGTDSLGRIQSEVIADNPGNTVTGVKVWKTVVSGSRQVHGTDPGVGNTITIGTGDKLGISEQLTDSFGLLFAEDTVEAVTVDTTNNAFSPTTLPNGATTYKFIGNI